MANGWLRKKDVTRSREAFLTGPRVPTPNRAGFERSEENGRADGFTQTQSFPIKSSATCTSWKIFKSILNSNINFNSIPCSKKTNSIPWPSTPYGGQPINPVTNNGKGRRCDRSEAGLCYRPGLGRSCSCRAELHWLRAPGNGMKLNGSCLC
jgi:hypothetical protein